MQVENRRETSLDGIASGPPLALDKKCVLARAGEHTAAYGKEARYSLPENSRRLRKGMVGSAPVCVGTNYPGVGRPTVYNSLLRGPMQMTVVRQEHSAVRTTYPVELCPRVLHDSEAMQVCSMYRFTCGPRQRVLVVAGRAVGKPPRFAHAGQKTSLKFRVRPRGGQVRDSGYAVPFSVALGKGPRVRRASVVPRLLESRRLWAGLVGLVVWRWRPEGRGGGTGDSLESTAEKRGGNGSAGLPELSVEASNPDPPSPPVAAVFERDGGPGPVPRDLSTCELHDDCINKLDDEGQCIANDALDARCRYVEARGRAGGLPS